MGRRLQFLANDGFIAERKAELAHEVVHDPGRSTQPRRSPFVRGLYAWLPARREEPNPGEPPDLDQDEHEGDSE